MKLLRSTVVIGAVLLIFIGLITTSVAAEEKERIFTLETSIAEALASNWNLKAMTEKIDQAIHRKKQAKAEFLPKLSTNYSYTRLGEVRTFRSTLMTGGGEIAVSSQDNFRWSGTVQQPLFTGFALTSSYRLAELGIDLSKMNVELEKLDLILNVKVAYFNILIADKGVEVAKKEAESLESNVKVTRNFFKVGMIPVNDVLKAEVELANAQQNLVKALNASKLTRSTFNTVLSRPIGKVVQVEDILNYQPEKGDFEEYLKKALENRPEIKAIDINILQNDQQTILVKSKYYPEIAFSYSYIKEGDDPSVEGSTFHEPSRWEATTALSWTFWEWGKTKSAVNQQESVRIELIQTKKALEDSIRLQLKEAELSLEEAEKNIPTTSKAVEQGEENLRVSEERYKAQVTTITEVLDAQTLLTQARVNSFRALYDHNLARARLERAIGLD